jgi:hypothetical protein
MKYQKKVPTFLHPFLILAVMLLMFGCSDETPMSPVSAIDWNSFQAAEKAGVDQEFQDGSVVPEDLVAIDCFGQTLTFWPFTGAKLDGVPTDPVNLVFTGQADPVQIRAALLGLDGDRSALGLPNEYPFNQIWKDALGGGVQASFEGEGGWRGSVLQLTLGDYHSVRFHLRLFRTGARGENGYPITVGAAHFEVLIPGTTDHQVLSWNAAKELVVGDMMRTGLLNPAEDLIPSTVITPVPGFRTIIPAVYNNLPPALLAIVGGPPPPVEDPVAIPNDGVAMIIHLAGSAPVTPDETQATATIEFGQFVPRPYCSSGPYDYLWIEGPVDFHNTASVDQNGHFSYQGGYSGTLTAVPINPNNGQPVGPAFSANVSGNQEGFMEVGNARVRSQDKKITFEGGSPQREHIQLMFGENGADKYKGFTKCLDDE